MTEREHVLKRWVSQPPDSPVVQYLRDAERDAALDRLGQQTTVLDVASESSVTAGLDADRVTRVDFSTEASAHAADILETAVDRYETTAPEAPTLPFDDSAFDAAVSIGPFDWKFLDVGALVDELHRVVDDEGLVVFSVPTPRSPYATDSRNRSYRPEDALGLISPDYRLQTDDQLFQYPSIVHGLITLLPDAMQEPFVEVADELSDTLSDRDAWDWASYLVVGASPTDYESYLADGLDCLFRPTDEQGFYDPDEGKFVRAFDYRLDGDGGSPTWTLDDSVQWRYAPFALMGALAWRTSPLGTDRYDEELTSVLSYFVDRVGEPDTLDAMPSYGQGPLVMALSLAGDVFDDDRYTDAAYTLYEYTRDAYDFSHAEDSLLLFGWSYLYEQTGAEAVEADIRDGLWELNERLTSEGLFAFDNPTARRHQNQMYTLWGLCRAIEVTDSDGYLSTAERVLDYTIRERMRADGAFIWEDLPRSSKLRTAVGRTVGLGRDRPPYWSFLYECHQTFFVNAVERYYAAGGSKDYQLAVRRAMAWIYGHNDLETNLVDYSGLGVPMRFLTTDERMDVPDQMYKGSYEVGSYVMALTHLLSGQVAPRR